MSIFGLFVLTTFNESSHMLTIPSTLALTHMMLAGEPFPHGLGAGLATTGYVVEGCSLSSQMRDALPGYY
jgi:hypothetical protein